MGTNSRCGTIRRTDICILYRHIIKVVSGQAITVAGISSGNTCYIVGSFHTDIIVAAVFTSYRNIIGRRLVGVTGYCTDSVVSFDACSRYCKVFKGLIGNTTDTAGTVITSGHFNDRTIAVCFRLLSTFRRCLLS